MKTTKNEIKQTIAELTGLSIELDIEDNSRLEEDLGIDSLDKIELAMKIETAFDINIPDSIIEEKLNKVSDIYIILEELGIKVID